MLWGYPVSLGNLLITYMNVVLNTTLVEMICLKKNVFFVRCSTRSQHDDKFWKATGHSFETLRPVIRWICLVKKGDSMSSTGWWFQTWHLFSIQLGIIIPTDFHIFQRVETTNQSNCLYRDYICIGKKKNIRRGNKTVNWTTNHVSSST